MPGPETTQPTEYQQLQEDAKLLDINPNQKKEILEEAISEATTPVIVVNLNKLLKDAEEANEELREKIGSIGTPASGTDGLEKIRELYEAQMADKNVYTEPYLTGRANAFLEAIGIITGEDMTENLLKPITQVAIKGAKVPTGRQRLIKEASKYIATTGDRNQLRSGLSAEDIKEADRIMKALGGKPGVYIIPAE